jgi:hypothetical protein
VTGGGSSQGKVCAVDICLYCKHKSLLLRFLDVGSVEFFRSYYEYGHCIAMREAVPLCSTLAQAGAYLLAAGVLSLAAASKFCMWGFMCLDFPV